MNDVITRERCGHGHDDMSCWFGLSYASFLTIPRVLMESMPDEWQGKMAALLREYDEAFANRPNVGARVQITDELGHLVKTPRWLIEYRRPDLDAVDACRSGSTTHGNARTPTTPT